MIFSEIQLPANPEGEVPLTLEQVWKGLEQKARNAVPYVEAITECRVIHEESDTVFDREVLLGGARYVERIWLGKPYLVVFTRTAGPVLGNDHQRDPRGGRRAQPALPVRPQHRSRHHAADHRGRAVRADAVGLCGCRAVNAGRRALPARRNRLPMSSTSDRARWQRKLRERQSRRHTQRDRALDWCRTPPLRCAHASSTAERDTMPVRTFDVFEGLPTLKLANNRQSVAELHAHLRRLIMDEELPPGTELNQADLGRRYNVSRGPMREALRLLQQEGLIDMQLNQRATVRQLNGNEVDQLYGDEGRPGILRRPRHCRSSPAGGARCCPRVAGQDGTGIGTARHATLDDRILGIPLKPCSARAEGPLAEIILSYSERSERYLRYAQNTHPRVSPPPASNTNASSA